jgi:hypothetical protein
MNFVPKFVPKLAKKPVLDGIGEFAGDMQKVPVPQWFPVQSMISRTNAKHALFRI